MVSAIATEQDFSSRKIAVNTLYLFFLYTLKFTHDQKLDDHAIMCT